MSTETNKAVLRRWFEAMNTRDLAVLDDLADQVFAAEYVVHDPGMPDFARGPAGMKKWLRGAFTNLPDMQITVEDVIAEGDRVACRFVVQGTPAGGGAVRFRALSITRLEGGKMAEEWELTGPVAA
jgi:predicted ester cyclase